MGVMNKELDKNEPVFSRTGPILGSLMLGQLLVETCLNREKLSTLFRAIDRKMMVLCGMCLEGLMEDQKRMSTGGETNQAELQKAMSQCTEK